MQNEESLTPAEREFEAALAGLHPAASVIDRDALMYRAGYAAASRRSRPWQATAALLAMALAGSLAMRAVTPSHTPAVQYVTGPDNVRLAMATPAMDSPNSAPAVAEPRYLVLRDEVLQQGLASLPESTGGQVGQTQPLTVQELLGEPAQAANPFPTEPRMSIMGRIFIGDRS